MRFSENESGSPHLVWIFKTGGFLRRFAALNQTLPPRTSSRGPSITRSTTEDCPLLELTTDCATNPSSPTRKCSTDFSLLLKLKMWSCLFDSSHFDLFLSVILSFFFNLFYNCDLLRSWQKLKKLRRRPTPDHKHSWIALWEFSGSDENEFIWYFYLTFFLWKKDTKKRVHECIWMSVLQKGQ